MSRRFKILVALVVVLVALIGVGLWALPEIVRRVAVAKIAALTGRATRIERVELNLFTGRFAVSRLAVARRPGRGPEAFLEFERLEGRVALTALLGSEIRVTEIRLVRPGIRVTRTGRLEFDFADVLELLVRPVGKDEPSRFTVSVGQVLVSDGTIVMDDVFLAPPVQWRIDDLGIEAAGFTTKADRPPAVLRLGARIGDTRLGMTSGSIRLSPVEVSLDLSLTDFDLARVRPYLPPDLPAVPESGTLGLALHLERVRTGEALAQSELSGEVRLKGFSAVRPGQASPFLRLDRLDVRIARMDFLAREVALGAIELEGLDLTAARDTNGNVDLLSMLRPSSADAAAPASEHVNVPPPAQAAPQDATSTSPRGPPAGGARAQVKLERLAVRSGTVSVKDEAVTPAREWRIEDVTVDGAGLSTVAADAPATLKVRAQVSGRPGSARPATVSVDADSIRLMPFAGVARIELDGMALASIRPYWPESTPAVAPEGMAQVSVKVDLAREDSGRLGRAVASGRARLDGLDVVPRGQSARFLRIPTLTVEVKQVDAVARTVALGVVAVDGADLRVVRGADGQIDLLAMAPAAEPALEVVKSKTGLALEKAPQAPAPPSGAEWRLSLDRFDFGKGALTFEDRAVTPATTLTLNDVALTVERAAWPFTRPATFSLSAMMPGGGRTDGKGTVVLEPLNLQVALSTRESPIEPYQAYFPFEARLLGLFSGDSLSEVQRGPKGELILASRGTAWGSGLEVRAPGVADPPIRMDALVIRDIDFSWPNYALVDRVVLSHPQIVVERDALGAMNLRTLFTPREKASAESDRPASGGAPPAQTAAGSENERSAAPGDGGPLQTMVIDFNAIDVEDGFARFVDHTTTPPFSEDVSRLALSIKGLSSVAGRSARTTLTAQALIGSDGTLDLRGDLSGLGETLRADLVAELRDFSLPSANPYADSLISWTVQRGTLEAKVHYHVEGDRLTAQHDLEFKKLRVEKSRDSDQAKRRLGVPLGLAVALLKDSNGDIDFSLPLNGTLSDKNFDWAETMWAGVKQVIVKVLLSPFSAVGRLLKGGDDSVDKLQVEPVAFSPGSAVIAPSSEAQLGRVADFLRRSPQIKVTLSPVVSAGDVERVKEQEVASRIESFRRERQLPDQAAALRAYYEQALPGTAVPKTVGEQMAALAARESVPEARLADLVHRRLEATRDGLVKGRGIPDGRVAAPALPPSPDGVATDGPGRVEFTIAPLDG